MKEKAIENQILIWLRYNGFYAQKVQSGALMKSYTSKQGTKHYRINLADEGTPDILACIRGKFVGIEIKKDLKEIQKWEKELDQRSRAQHHQQSLIRESGGITLVVCSVEDLETDLKTLNLFS